MATLVTPTDLQKMEFDVTTAEGPSRVTVVTGKLPISLTGGLGNEVGSFKVLLDPTLTPGQFRKATAIAALGRAGLLPQTQQIGAVSQCRINNAQATFDDEAGKVQLVVDFTATNAQSAQEVPIWFQVTTLARVPAA